MGRKPATYLFMNPTKHTPHSTTQEDVYKRQGLSFLILGLHLVDGLLQFLSAVREINKASTVRQPFLVFRGKNPHDTGGGRE